MGLAEAALRCCGVSGFLKALGVLRSVQSRTALSPLCSMLRRSQMSAMGNCLFTKRIDLLRSKKLDMDQKDVDYSHVHIGVSCLSFSVLPMRGAS